ncbi:hypothetical protein F5Y17DRAFT_429340 [Xylariaceae sp. FL0594]|nr:hypothetical protein F5Y17DRAFT_429340 [Xylariaceae sp. FL0594]
MVLLSRLPVAPRLLSRRYISTKLSNNVYIKAFPVAQGKYLLSYLDTEPPTERLAIGTTTELPPTPRSFTENHEFLAILNDVLRKHAAQDPSLRADAQAFASRGGATLGSHGAFSPRQQRQRGTRKTAFGNGADCLADGGASGASGQGGAGGADVGGHVHLSDLRNPPDFGRIAFPEDILGSIEVDKDGQIVGQFEPSGTYRIITNEGILGLTHFLRDKLVQKLAEEEQKAR